MLYVDGDDAREDAARDLEDRGFDVRTVDREAAALERIGWADCVVAEYDLPDGDGLELLESVRRRAPGLPFVLFTGAGSEALASEAIGAGATDYVPKDADEPVVRLADGIQRRRPEATAGADATGGCSTSSDCRSTRPTPTAPSRRSTTARPS